jgi:hypothetical protein
VEPLGTPQSERGMHVVERYRLIDAEEARKRRSRHESVAGRVGGKEGNNPIDANYGKGLQVQVRIGRSNVFTAPWSALVRIGAHRWRGTSVSARRTISVRSIRTLRMCRRRRGRIFKTALAPSASLRSALSGPRRLCRRHWALYP